MTRLLALSVDAPDSSLPIAVFGLVVLVIGVLAFRFRHVVTERLISLRPRFGRAKDFDDVLDKILPYFVTLMASVIVVYAGIVLLLVLFFAAADWFGAGG